MLILDTKLEVSAHHMSQCCKNTLSRVEYHKQSSNTKGSIFTAIVRCSLTCRLNLLLPFILGLRQPGEHLVLPTAATHLCARTP